MDDVSVSNNALPVEEQRSVWSETEHNFWQEFEQADKTSRVAVELEHQNATMDVRLELATLTGKHAEILATRDRLSHELAHAEEDLIRVSQQCEQKSAILKAMERDYQLSVCHRMEKQAQVIRTMKNFFRVKRNGESDLDDRQTQVSNEHFRALTRPLRAGHSEDSEISSPSCKRHKSDCVSPASTASLSSHATSELAEPLVRVMDADGNTIGQVKKIEPRHQWVKAILEMPIQRAAIVLRRGCKLTPNDLASLHDRYEDPCEGKGVEWLSCIIQATGQVQERKCTCCETNQGVFEECVILGGPLFQKCGNCVWSRRACHVDWPPNLGPLIARGRLLAATTNDPYGRGELATSPAGAHPPDPTPWTAGSGKPQGSQGSRANPAGKPLDQRDQSLHEPVQMLTPQEPPDHSILASSCQHSLQTPEYPVVKVPAYRNGFTAANGVAPTDFHAHLAARGLPAPSASIDDHTPCSTPARPLALADEITRENLVLQHNGVVYTYPEVVEGVPLVKIDEAHPYWDATWPSIRSIVEPQLKICREKHVAAVEARSRGEGGSAKFQTGRQVNRGEKILKYLEEGEINPYQLLAKKFIHTGKGAITSYDTLFRLCETVAELARFGLDVSPIDWLRHRLHELHIEQGADFNLARILHNFYHDAKLSALRSKNGFKSIGRPSGSRQSQVNGTPQSSAKKRKTKHLRDEVPTYNPPGTPSVLATQASTPAPAQIAARAASVLTQRTVPLTLGTEAEAQDAKPPMKPPIQSATTSESSDSEADAWRRPHDADENWRLYQVKTRLHLTSADGTQYWGWIKGSRSLQHQLLHSKPPTWSAREEAAKLSVHLDEVIAVQYNLELLQVLFVIRTEPTSAGAEEASAREHVVAAFSRERTMRRFLNFCQDQQLRTTEISLGEMDHNWSQMSPQQLPPHVANTLT